MNEAPETPAPQGSASDAPAPEPLSAILAEMRAAAKSTDLFNGEEVGEPLIRGSKVKDYADRIEEAVKRHEYELAECERCARANTATMRHALKRILDIEGYGAPWIEAKVIAQKALEGQQCTPPIAQERPKIEQPGNIAALREAMEATRDLLLPQCNGGTAFAKACGETVNKIMDALAASARNCDRTKDEAEDLFKERFGRALTQTEDELAVFLFAPAKENGGNKQ